MHVHAKKYFQESGYLLFIAQRAADYGTHARVGLTLVLLGPYINAEERDKIDHERCSAYQFKK